MRFRWVAATLAVLVSTRAAACPVFDVAADQATTAVRGFQFAIADEALAEALTAVGCAAVDDPKRLARLMRIHGARRFLDGDADGGSRYFAAARALDPATFESETWGDEALAAWWRSDPAGAGQGTLAVLVPDGAEIVVDGQPGRNPTKISALPHVVRVSTVAARLADVQPEATTVIDLASIELPSAPPAPEPAVEPVAEAVPEVAEPTGAVTFHHSELSVKKRVTPEFPASARAMGVTDGSCRVRVFIDVEGRPTELRFEACPRAFQETTEAAVKQWRWEPARVRGEPVAAQFVLTVQYAAR